MWPPENPHFLPSRIEIQETKEEIINLERELAEALLLIDRLKTTIFERRAYIAPIRTLPHEVLSRIFVELSQGNWKTPLKLQSVCRIWRAVLLDTPLAWTFIPFKRYIRRRPDLLCFFMEKSREVPLHLSLVERPPDRVREKFVEMRRRIACLKVGRWGFSLLRDLDESWSRLNKLCIDHRTAIIGIQINLPIFDISGLAPLRALHIHNADSLLASIAASSTFPALKELIIHCTDPSPLDIIMSKSAESIKYMDLTYDGMAYKGAQPAARITFPKLKFLCLTNKPKNNNTKWLFNGEAPNLVGLFMLGRTGTFLWPSSVVYLGTTELIDLSPFPELRFLHVTFYNSMANAVVEYLHGCPSSCPHLRAVTYASFAYAMLGREELKRVEEWLDPNKPKGGFSGMNHTQARNLCQARVPDVVDIHGPCSAL